MAPILQPAPNSSDDDSGGDADKSFVPHWSGQLQLNHSDQPSQQGGGQTTNDLTLTGTDNFNEAGSTYFSAGLTGGSQKVEGVQSHYGALSVGGGLELGVFLPSLTLQGQYGESALKNYSGTLDLNFQVFDPLTVGLEFVGGLESHQGPASQVIIVLATSDKLVEIDTKEWTAGITSTFQAFDDLSFLTTLEQETDITYQWQTVNQVRKKEIDQEDRIPSITLGFDWTFLKDFTLEVTGQYGKEYIPAGTTYSPILAETITTSTATTQNFYGDNISLTYDF
jgi:hypothetical protein